MAQTVTLLSYFREITDSNLCRDTNSGKVSIIHKGGDRSLVTNYIPVSLTSVVCKQMERVIVSYLRQVWDKNYWFYEGQHGFRPGYSCESRVITVCQDIRTLWITETGLTLL